MRIVITGAAGLVGSHLSRTWSRRHNVLALNHNDLDITDREAVLRRLSSVKPSLIVNCAVLQVDACEQDSAKAQAVNVDGPRFLAAAASQLGAEIVHFSSQYAFSGEPIGRLPYTIEDTPAPINGYGKTKVASEQAVRHACVRSYILRTSWVYGSGKSSFLCTAHNDLRAGKRVRAIVDIWSSTTYVEDLIERMQLILNKRRYGTYHIVNEGLCSYHQFAMEAGRLVGLNRAQLDRLIEQVHERDMQRIAPRPRYTPMRCLLSERLGLPPMRDWRSALADYVDS